MTTIETYPLDVKKFIVETMRLPPGAKACYLMILLDYCSAGSAPQDNDVMLAATCGIYDVDYWKRTARPLLESLFEIRDGRWYHADIEVEIKRQSMVKAVAMTASKAAKAKRDKRKGLTAEERTLSPEAAAVIMSNPQPHSAMHVLPPSPPIAAEHAPPLDHPIPPDIVLNGADVIDYQNRGASADEIAGWFNWFVAYHNEAGTMNTDWPASLRRFLDKKLAERDAKPKAAPRLELSRRAPAPPVDAS